MKVRHNLGKYLIPYVTINERLLYNFISEITPQSLQWVAPGESTKGSSVFSKWKPIRICKKFNFLFKTFLNISKRWLSSSEWENIEIFIFKKFLNFKRNKKKTKQIEHQQLIQSCHTAFILLFFLHFFFFFSPLF